MSNACLASRVHGTQSAPLVDGIAAQGVAVVTAPCLYRLHPEVLIDILTWMEPNEVCRLSLTCRPLRSICLVADTIVWRQLCVSLWRGKQGFNQFVERVDIALACQRSTTAPTTACSLRAGGAKIRGSRATSVQFSPDTTLRCIQASILPAATAVKRLPPMPVSLQLPPPVGNTPTQHSPLRRRFWWELTPSEQARRLRRMLCERDGCSNSSTTTDVSTSDDDGHSNAAENSDPCMQQLEQHWLQAAAGDAPHHDWSASVTWKFAYFMSVRDSKRSRLAAVDLSSMTWKVAFRQIPDRWFPARFDTELGKLITPVNPDGFMFQLSQQGTELQVHVFPTMHISRNLELPVLPSPSPSRSEWGWSIKNYFVEITSDDVPSPHYLRFLRLYSSIRPP